MSVNKFSRSSRLASPGGAIQIIPGNVGDLQAFVNPTGGGGAAGLVEFSTSDDFVSIQKKQAPVVGAVVNGGTNFTVDLSADPDFNLTTDAFDGLAVAIETETQTKIFATINDITAGVWDLEEILSGEAFASEPGATSRLYLAPGAPATGPAVNEGVQIKDVPGVKTNGLLALWSAWTPGVVTADTQAPLPSAITGVRFTASVAGVTNFEVAGSRVQG